MIYAPFIGIAFSLIVVIAVAGTFFFVGLRIGENVLEDESSKIQRAEDYFKWVTDKYVDLNRFVVADHLEYIFGTWEVSTVGNVVYFIEGGTNTCLFAEFSRFRAL